ncbi:hypothetical protein G9G39_06820 [Cronobacter sp. EKM101R]|nr:MULTISPECIES: hypothetical protein [Cronobacter]KAF6596771.1 hypothetical protein G9G39_06820 [Cronobacter sp. EKM101R]KAF6599597.1 hypothetical protein G9G38_06455 [Cronobacter sp. EKM102R]MDK1185165.1 hypothetical protein [Cronobacter turicensis]MDK1195296.1 hypothetical protein [Cronobacter dublinensis]MDK1200439.1 hypothetical protein [Cronobacter dublinensis]
MKRWICLVALLIPFITNAEYQEVIDSRVTVPGGKEVYFVAVPSHFKDSENDSVIYHSVIYHEDLSSFTKSILLNPKVDPDPKKTLVGFSSLKLSPDAKTLYFESAAWATSSAIHAMNLKNKEIKYITDGSLTCVVGAGEYQGHLIVSRHQYFVQGGSYDDYWLYSPSGKKIGRVASENATKVDLLKLCTSLS